ncbi:NAD(P)/FAD-dependent oxidoreductase [Nocardia sp. NPDC050697]|uniref:flavin-containing monooxygenase n=1 Tax=Nocardia sp. NPDC050697 TaxID=3155158 RepID=UPI0033E6736A
MAGLSDLAFLAAAPCGSGRAGSLCRMTSRSRVAIVGAGIAGLACAKVLRQEGFPVEVFDRAPDVGGVWSATRRYPGLRAQSSSRTYRFSDLPMPDDFPDRLDGAQMQSYLESYVRRFDLGHALRLNTEVVAADPVDSGWLLEVRDGTGVHRTSCDHLIIANGVHSDPRVPEFTGSADFARAGGQMGHSSLLSDLAAARGRNVVVVGYGTAACEIAEAVSHVAASTTVVARRLRWKLARRAGRFLDAERLLQSRFGESHFGYQRQRRPEKFLNGPGRSVRDSNLDLIQERTIRSLHLRELELVPEEPFGTVAHGTVDLAVDGFTEQVWAGRLTVVRDTVIEALGAEKVPVAHLSDGQTIPADLVICATGYQQRVPFLTPFVQRQLTDDAGNFRLYRQILPPTVPRLSFAGYGGSALSALAAEAGAHWTAALLTHRLDLPGPTAMGEALDERLSWLAERTGGGTHGTEAGPFGVHHIDELLADLHAEFPARLRFAQWFRPVTPDDLKVIGAPKPELNTQPRPVDQVAAVQH